MEKHLLVTVSEQQSAHYGVRFVGHLFSNKEGLRLTLYYTAPRAPAVWEGERTHDGITQSEQKAQEYKGKGRKALEAARKELLRMGFKQEQLDTKLQVRQHSKVVDIIQEGEKGLYDAVVLGRRGLSWLAQTFDESTSQELLDKKATFPIWLCRRPEPEQKNILVCVDGSEASYRMADHVGFILAQEETQSATLFTVKKRGTPASKDMESILSKGREHLLSNGFPKERTTTKVVEADNTAKAILREAEQDRYAAVAMGRTGADQGLLKRVFMGSVSTALFKELEKTALWVCH